MATFSLMDLPTMSFAPSRQADETGDKLATNIGLRERYQAARLAIARSLAVKDKPELLPSGTDRGRAIRGQNLFGSGSDIAAWISLIVEYSDKDDISREELLSIVASHWHRGMEMLWEEWKSAGSDYEKFLLRLAKQAGLSAEAENTSPRGGTTNQATLRPCPVNVRLGEIGTDEKTGAPVTWPLNSPGHSPHFAILGEVGTGKTRTLNFILKQVRDACSPPAIIFDLKGDLRDNKELIRIFNAQVIDVPRMPVPLDVLTLDDTSDTAIKLAADRFEETFKRAKRGGFGAPMLDAVKEAARRALVSKQPTTLSAVRDALFDVYAERSRKEDGATAFLNSLCNYELFQPVQRIEEFFNNSWILTFPDSTEEIRRLVGYLVLDALDRYLNGGPDAPTDENHNRAIRTICVIDEARELLGERQPALVRLVRMSRSKGGVMALVSQSPDDFAGEDDDFLGNVGLTLAFRTNAKPAQLSRVLGQKVDLGALKDGVSITRIADAQGHRRIVRIKSYEPKK